MSTGRALALAWAVALGVPLAVRLWNATTGPLMWGYDAWGHVAHVLFLDLYRGLPWPDQGWSYFHPPLHYAIGWLLAQGRDAELLVRGLSLWSGAASLGTAALAAWLVRRSSPASPLLVPVAFAAVALLPAHLLLCAMPGNELTLTLLSSASVCAFAANESRERPGVGLDLLCGGLAGLALLTKFSGLLPVLTVAASLALRALLTRAGFARAAGRAALVAGVAFVVAAPYYQRNVAAYGTPFQLSREFQLVSRVESKQGPGNRSLVDYLRVSPQLFLDPEPRAPHMLGSVWGTVYANVWADVFRESDVERATKAHASAGAMALLGLLPTVLFVWGLGLGVGDVRRDRRRGLTLPLLVHAGGTVAAFAVFSWQVPIWSALKSSYLLGLSLPFGVFLVRGLERFAHRGPGVRALLGLSLGGVGLACAVLAVEGWVLPRRADAPATAAVRFYFGDTRGAAQVYRRLAAGARTPIPWLDGLGAIALVEGRPEEARELYGRAVNLEPAARRFNRSYRRGQRAVATALAGDPATAANELDAVLAERDLPELRANRGALYAIADDRRAAEAQLRAALRVNPELLAARINLAVVLEATDRAAEARQERARAARQACRAPRRYPHGLGTGEVLEWGVGRRALLLLDGGGLRLATTEFYRDACRSLGGAA